MLHQTSYATLNEWYRHGKASPVDVVSSALAHVDRIDAEINAFALIDAAWATERARQSAERWRNGVPLGPLDGMPLTVKEFAAIAGWPTRRGSLVTADAPASESTVFVDRLLQGGAILLGKTRAPEFNWKGVTDSPGYGITRNPWDVRMTPGGSSGGCSAAVAAGVVRVSIGSDAGGSVRIPAAFTGMIGLKPTFGRIPAFPLPSAFSDIMHCGPIAADMGDLEMVLRAVSGPSSKDWTSVSGLRGILPTEPMRKGSVRIGLLHPQRWEESAPLVKRAMEQVSDILANGGHALRIVDFDIQTATNVARHFYWLGCAAAVRAVPMAHHDRLDPGLLQYVNDGPVLSIDDYLELRRQRDISANALAQLFDDIDLLMLPTLPITAFAAGHNVPPDWEGSDWMSWNPYTPAFNVTQNPALSYPVWPEDNASPASVQFVAPKFREDLLLTAGHWMQDRMPIRLSPMANR